jgi:Ca2+-binding EF-hand superfamily protein
MYWVADEIDEDKSGTLEEEEVKAFLERLEVKASWQEVRVLFARLDYTGTGSLSFSAFWDRINNWKKHGKDMQKMRKVCPSAPLHAACVFLLRLCQW